MGAITDGRTVSAKIVHPGVTSAGLRNAASNCILGASFFIAMIPAARALSWSLFGLANIVWLTGAAIMGILSFVRTPPRSTMVNASTIGATLGMLFIPARVYMGRSFGILPANRGVVSKGPFSSIRHPIYFGWLVLSIGYAMSYPTMRNIILLAATVPFMVWRIEQEEMHLREDSEYCVYERRVRFRLWPGVI